MTIDLDYKDTITSTDTFSNPFLANVSCNIIIADTLDSSLVFKLCNFINL